MIRVVLVDDQALFRAGIRMVIDSQPDLEVVGEAGDGAEGVRVVRAARPDVVLMDIRMPVMDGLAATAELLADGAPGAALPRIVMLTTFDLDEAAARAIQQGASGFLLKDADPEFLLAAIRTVHAGSAVIAASATRAGCATWRWPWATPQRSLWTRRSASVSWPPCRPGKRTKTRWCASSWPGLWRGCRWGRRAGSVDISA